MTRVLFLGTEEDRPYLSFLKSPLNSCPGTAIRLRSMELISEIAVLCKTMEYTHVVTTQVELLANLAPDAKPKIRTLDNYAGSWLTSKLAPGVVFLIVPPLKQCVTLPHGKFTLERYLSKITQPHKWLKSDEFSWILANNYQDMESMLCLIRAAILCTIDIETRSDLSISSIAFTTLHKDKNNNKLYTFTYVIPLPKGLSIAEYEFRFSYIRDACATNTPKLGQNTKYDIFHLLRFGCPINNWLYDTAIAHHCWFAELKKDLSTLGAFYLQEYIFWDVGSFEYDDDALYHYNALDTWNTTWVWLSWIKMSPDWAKNNYRIQFPVQFPSILMEVTGLLVDTDRMEEEARKQQEIIDRERESLGKILGVPGFNPSSAKQVGQLVELLTLKGKLKKISTEEKYLKKLAYVHPLNNYIIEKILNYRKAVKLLGTYLRPDKLYKGVMLYSLTSYYTRTARLKSEASSMWTGANIQNIPRDGSIKRCYIPFPGFKIGEADKAQAESYCTGFISGDPVLIDAITGPNDFHSFNGAKFFGKRYEEICRNNADGSYTILDKPLRQLSKPINHGCNYNMGKVVLADTMGLELVYKAAAMLKLPRNWTSIHITEYLISMFAKTYSVLTGKYYPWVIKQVTLHKLLIGATGWVRYCFGNPKDNKHDLNAYIAHAPQSLNAMQLNNSVYKVFTDIWIPNHVNFKLCAQVHDSILYQVRDGYEYLAQDVKRIMEETSVTDVTDIFGVTRTMSIPVDLSKLSSDSWYGCK